MDGVGDGLGSRRIAGSSSEPRVNDTEVEDFEQRVDLGFGERCVHRSGTGARGGLPEAERTTFLKRKGAAIFEPMPGRPMKEYVLVPPAVLDRDAEVERWLRVSREYVAALPPRERKAKKAAKSAKKGSAKRR